MFRRADVGSKGEFCDRCGTEKVYFVQHSHGNYPILDYVCPKCDLGGEKDIDWDAIKDEGLEGGKSN